MRYLSTAFALLSLIFLGHAVAQENRVVRDEMGFALTYPASFVRVEQNNPRVGVLLNHATNAFPTFNVTIESGVTFSPDEKAQKIAQAVLLSYVQIGLLDSRIKSISTLKIGEKKGFEIRLLYVSGGIPYETSVVIVQSPHATYYLTFIDTVQNFDRSLPLRDSLLAGFSLIGGEIAIDLDSRGSSVGWILPLVLVVVILAGIYFKVRRSKHLGQLIDRIGRKSR